MRTVIYLPLLLVFCGAAWFAPVVFAQYITPEAYIERYSRIAVEEMYRTGIPASIKLAQGFLESGFGNSELARSANNHFGVKGISRWKGETYAFKGAVFRKYDQAELSFRDHSDYLKSRKIYAPLFKISRTNYKAWAAGLQKAGYATDPTYAEHLTGIIERYNLQPLDTMTLEK